jgi:transcriptional regulator with XRE-family HTH domain
MDTEDTTLEIFLRDRMKDRGMSIKKLADLTGISIGHIENMLRGDFEHIPPTPYFRGYLIRIGEALNFDGEAWWEKIKKEEGVRKSGPADSLPENRFARKSPVKIVAISAAVLVLLILFGFALPHILGKPVITITSPQDNSSATSDSIVIQGTVKNADSLYVDGDEATIAKDGSWQKNVLLQSGINTFDVSAKKFLGGTTDIVEQIVYTPSAITTTIPSASPSSTTSTTPVK